MTKAWFIPPIGLEFNRAPKETRDKVVSVLETASLAASLRVLKQAEAAGAIVLSWRSQPGFRGPLFVPKQSIIDERRGPRLIIERVEARDDAS